MEIEQKEETFLEALLAFIGYLLIAGASFFAVLMFWAFMQ